MMKNVLNLYYFCIYFKKRPKNDLVLFRFVLYTPQGLKTYQSCRRSFQVNSFRVLADSAVLCFPKTLTLFKSWLTHFVHSLLAPCTAPLTHFAHFLSGWLQYMY